jgi:L-ascorbate metabolism protein UlaG (beta-lactamase superfamily)
MTLGLKYNHRMAENLSYRWLGTAGIEFEFRGKRLLVDPYLSRFPMRFLLVGRPAPRRELVRRHLRPAQTVLVSHSHFDHLADVPNVCREFGAAACGSPNTCAILRAHGISSALIRPVAAGDSFSAGPFAIRVFSGAHGRMAGWIPYAGRLPASMRLPLRLPEYRMDGMFSFHIRTEGGSVLIWNRPDADGMPPADILFCIPMWGVRSCVRTAGVSGAKTVVPVHWDDFFSPLDRPLRPMMVPPGWRSLWIRRMDPADFAASVNRLLPKVPVEVPRLFHQQELRQEM